MWLLMVLLPATILVLRSRGILTEHVVTHPITRSPFPQVFFVTGRSRFNYVELEAHPCLKGSEACPQ